MRSPFVTLPVVLLALILLVPLALTASTPPLGTLPEALPILLRTHVIDPQAGEPVLPPELTIHAYPPGSSGYYIVQLNSPILKEYKDALTAFGATVFDYLPNNAFIVRMDDQAKAQTEGAPFVRWIGILQPAYKIDPLLPQFKGSRDQRTLVVQIFPGEDMTQTLTTLTSLGGTIIETSENQWQGVIKLEVDTARLPEIARITGVKWIEEYQEPKLFNDVAAGIMNVPVVWNTGGLTGTGQIVAIADTGLDTGSLWTISQDFRGKILKTYALGRPPTTWGDPGPYGGHGTHVAGSLVGSGAYPPYAKGIAPGAQLIFQSVMRDNGNLSIATDLNNLFLLPYNDGARIHSNSWGASVNWYNIRAQTLDQFVWDHKDMSILVAAGNEGIDVGGNGVVDTGSLGTPATAKNAITVGASENIRLSGGLNPGAPCWTWGSCWPQNYPVSPLKDDRLSDNAGGMAALSSRGPAYDGRIKPDVVAPGTNILSSRSHAPGNPSTLWGAYNSDYVYSGGTSMATPLTAGAATLVRQFYAQVKGLSYISAALVKATLINGAFDMAPGQYGASTPGMPIYSDDMETTSTWTAGSSGGAAWHWTTADFHSPNHAWANGPYTNNTNAWITSTASINLTTIISPTLYFWHKYDLEPGYDFGYVEVLPNPAGSWTKVAAYTGASGWAYEGISLASFASSTALKIRFRLTSDSSYNYEGWYIDDVTIRSGATQEMGPRPNFAEGWGRIDLGNSLFPEARKQILFHDYTAGLSTNQELRLNYVVTDSAVPFRATLAWSDYPGSLLARLELVNDLDIQVSAPDGRVYYPNQLTSPDRLNNVEGVDIVSPPPGVYQVVIKAVNVPQGPQPFALVVSGAVAPHERRYRVYLPLVAKHYSVSEPPTATPAATPSPTPSPTPGHVDLQPSTFHVDKRVAAPDDRLVYSVRLRNAGADPAWQASFVASLPRNVTYAPDSATGGAVYNSILNRIEWAGAVPQMGSSLDYDWLDSGTPGGPAYTWIDITKSGTRIPVGDDVTDGPFDIGFSFPFYDNSFDRFYVSSNGWLSFSRPVWANSLNEDLPSPSAPLNMIAVWWDDLDPSKGGNIYYQRVDANTLVVEYHQVPRYYTGERYTFEAILKADGTITLLYQEMQSGHLGSATIGIQNADGTDGLTVVHDALYVRNQLAIRFFLQPGPGRHIATFAVTVNGGVSAGTVITNTVIISDGLGSFLTREVTTTTRLRPKAGYWAGSSSSFNVRPDNKWIGDLSATVYCGSPCGSCTFRSGSDTSLHNVNEFVSPNMSSSKSGSTYVVLASASFEGIFDNPTHMLGKYTCVGLYFDFSTWPPRVYSCSSSGAQSASWQPLKIQIVPSATKPVPGSELTYHIQYWNLGGEPLFNVTITDTLPISTTFLSESSPEGWSRSQTADSMVWSTTSLPAYASGNIDLTVRVDENVANGARLRNAAEIRATVDATTQSASDTNVVVVTAPYRDLYVSKRLSEGAYRPGQNVVHDIAFGNRSNSPAQNVVLTDTSPVSMTYVSYSGVICDPDCAALTTLPVVSNNQIVWNLGTIQADGYGRIYPTSHISEAISVVTILTNTVQISSGDIDSNPSDNSASYSAPVYPPDRYEENDTFDTAATITLPFDQSNLTIDYSGDADYYRFSLATISDLTVTITFTNSQGDLNLALYDSAQTQLSSSTGTSNQEQIIVRGLRPGSYFIKVYGYYGAINRYRLVATAGAP